MTDEPETLKLYAREGETHAETAGRYAMAPHLQAAVTLTRYALPGFGDVSLGELTKALQAQAEAANRGDFTRAESMLTSQAHTLDAIFNNLARISARRETVDSMATYLKLALRAQSQCRSTLEALAEIKAPKAVAFVRQANITHGHQQVNNNSGEPTPDDAAQTKPPPARARKKRKSAKQTKQVRQDEKQTLDATGKTTPSRANPAMAAVGARHRP